MAGYSTINTQFRPLSYQEVAEPAMLATQAHMLLEELQENLRTLSSQWELKLANERDPKIKLVYKGYMDELNTAADTLSSKGLTPEARKSLYNLKAGYAQKIVPIEEAYKKYQEELNNRKLLQLQDSSRIFEDGDISISSFYNNPAQQYKSMSGKELYESAARDFENMSKINVTAPNFGGTIGGGQYFKLMKESGYTKLLIMNMISKGEGPKELVNLYNIIKRDYTSRGNWGEEGNAKIIDNINRAAMYAIGDKEWTPVKNNMWDYSMEEARKNKEIEIATQPLPYGYVGGAVDATNSTKVLDYEKKINFLKELQKSKDLNKFFKKLETKITSTVAPTTGVTMINITPEIDNKAEYNALVKQYGTKNPTQLIAAINKDIKRTSSQYRNVILKQPDTSILSTTLYQEHITRNNPKLITDTDGKPIKDPEVLKKIFDGKGQFGIDKMKGQAFMISPTTGLKVLIDASLLSNIPSGQFMDAALTQPISLYDKIQGMNKRFLLNPEVDNPQDNIDVFDPLIQYNRNIVQEATTSNSKVTNDAGPRKYSLGGQLYKYNL